MLFVFAAIFVSLFGHHAKAVAAATPPLATLTWQGVTLGEDEDAVAARLGQPQYRRKGYPGTFLLHYSLQGGYATLLLTERDHKIVGVRTMSSQPRPQLATVLDPFGVKLGDSAQQLLIARGEAERFDDHGDGEATSTYTTGRFRWVYDTRDGVVYAIAVYAPLPPPVQLVAGPTKPVPEQYANQPVVAPPPRPSPVPSAQYANVPLVPSNTPEPAGYRNGSTMERAVIVKAGDQTAGFDFIYKYIAERPCVPGVEWRIVGSEILNQRRRNFNRFDVECPPTGTRGIFWFDVTAFFGKAER